MKKEHNKMMADLQRLIASQDFKSEAEMNDFFKDHFSDGKVPTLEPESLSPSELAQDLVFNAFELPEKSALSSINNALILDEDCIEAYEYLGSIQSELMIARIFYSIGVEKGRKKFGGKYLKENKGMFWGLHETRPFMRCIQQLSDCQYHIGNKLESIKLLEELIDLNPNDNQGIRDQLLLYIIEANDKEKIKKHIHLIEDEDSAFALFSMALLLFKNKGDNLDANKKLREAMKSNPFVFKKLTAKSNALSLPDYVGRGDKNEAQYYAYFAKIIWEDTEGAIAWLKQQYKKK